MILLSLPDCKMFHKDLRIGSPYEIVGTLGNCVKILTDAGEPIWILAERLYA